MKKLFDRVQEHSNSHRRRDHNLPRPVQVGFEIAFFIVLVVGPIVLIVAFIAKALI